MRAGCTHLAANTAGSDDEHLLAGDISTSDRLRRRRAHAGPRGERVFVGLSEDPQHVRAVPRAKPQIMKSSNEVLLS